MADRAARGAAAERKVGAILEGPRAVRIPVERIDERMLRQAYAESKLLQKVSGLDVTPLLVFSEAFLVGWVPARRHGVTVLPARMLGKFMEERPATLAPDEVIEIAERLRLALEVDAGPPR